MVPKEVFAFLDMFTDFLNIHAGSRMVVEEVGLWNQQFVLAENNNMEENETLSGEVVATAATNAKVVSREVSQKQNQRRKKKKSAAPMTRNGEISEKINALRLTCVLQVSFTTLPPEMIGRMAVAIIQENRIELDLLLKVLEQSHSYFESIDGILDVYEMETLELPTPPPAMNNPSDSDYDVKTDDDDLAGGMQGPSVMCESYYVLFALICCISRVLSWPVAVKDYFCMKTTKLTRVSRHWFFGWLLSNHVPRSHY